MACVSGRFRVVAGRYWEKNSSKGTPSCGGSMVDEGSEQVGFTVQEECLVFRCGCLESQLFDDSCSRELCVHLRL